MVVRNDRNSLLLLGQQRAKIGDASRKSHWFLVAGKLNHEIVGFGNKGGLCVGLGESANWILTKSSAMVL